MLMAASSAEKKAEKKLTVENGAIPSDFGKNNVTMLVVRSGKNNYDKYLIKNFESYPLNQK